MDISRLLHHMPLFADLSKDELQMLAQITTSRHYHRNQVIIKAGERGDVFFLLIAGAVRVSVEGHREKAVTLGVLYPNDFFGEMALLDGLPRSATVTALAESQVLIIARKDFLECIQKVPQIATKMIVTLSLRLRRADQQIGNLVFLRAPRRVASTLLELALGQGQRLDKGVVIELHFTRQELAALAGVSRETFARLLTKFRHMGILTVERRRLYIPDLHRLEELT
jgi:CRP/FNR family transcriptional regulator/CRP/FNR family cyclic AMP-dependent transcriptional regulator